MLAGGAPGRATVSYGADAARDNTLPYALRATLATRRFCKF